MESVGSYAVSDGKSFLADRGYKTILGYSFWDALPLGKQRQHKSKTKAMRKKGKTKAKQRHIDGKAKAKQKQNEGKANARQNEGFIRPYRSL